MNEKERCKLISVVIPTYNRKKQLPGVYKKCSRSDISQYRSTGCR